MDVVTLIRAGMTPTTAKAWAPFFEPAGERFQINTPERIAAFVSQMRVETAEFSTLEENLRYRPERAIQIPGWSKRLGGLEGARRIIAQGPQALANVVYANRMGNGPPESGDGWRYRGSGCKQLTFRDNYRAVDMDLLTDYEAHPEKVREPEGAALTAAHYWARNKCNIFADRRDWNGITLLVNGPGMMAAATRRNLTVAALAELQGA
jgi:putative chitinase